jgi:hypothetical protein
MNTILNIIFDNRNKKPVHKCNVCDRQDVWSNKWKAIGFGIGVGYRGEDRHFITCSEKCRKEDKEKKLFEKYRKNLHDEWWKHNEDYVEDFEKEFKNLFKE